MEIESGKDNSKKVIYSRFLKKCNAIEVPSPVTPFAFIIFGGTGDLAGRMILPSLFHLYQDDELHDDFIVIGTGRSIETTDEYRMFVRESISESSDSGNDSPVSESFIEKVNYFKMDIKDNSVYSELREEAELLFGNMKKRPERVILYLAVSPLLFEEVILSAGRLFSGSDSFRVSVIVEKPFGRDRESAAHLNNVLKENFSENDIFRIDHYLGKETVQNIIFFRFSNSILEPLWNNKYIDNVQIIVAESIGIERRGGYYNNAGVIRDMIQNHMMQLISLIAMEPPAGFEADFVRDEKLKVFKSFRPLNPESCKNFIFGQYAKGEYGGQLISSYRDEYNIPGNSVTPTFAAGKFYIDNWRWAGVPFYIRSGKRLKKRITEICIQFKQPPLKLFGRTCDSSYPNLLVITIQPEEEIKLRLGMKFPGDHNKIFMADLKFNYPDIFNIRKHPPYERLILDCLCGDLTLFARQDSIEAMWDIVDPVVEYSESNLSVTYPYSPGTWGPAAADDIVEEEGNHWYTK